MGQDGLSLQDWKDSSETIVENLLMISTVTKTEMQGKLLYFIFCILFHTCCSETLSRTPSMDLPHFLNFHNSCAVDCLLDLSFYCFYDVHCDSNSHKLGPLSNLLSVVNSERQVKNECPRALQEPVWDWLCRNIPSFSNKGSADAAVADVFPCLLDTQFEKGTFGVSFTRHFLCTSCENYIDFPARTLNPVLLMKDEVLCANKAIDVAVVNSINSFRSTACCTICNEQSLTSGRVSVQWPDFLCVQLPVLPCGSDAVTAVENDVVDLTAEVSNASHQNSISISSVNQELGVMPDITVPDRITLESNKYDLIGAVKCRKNHFSISVKKGQLFYHVDGCNIYTPNATTFPQLCGQPFSSVYKTSISDGYFIFLFRKIQSGMHTTFPDIGSISSSLDIDNGPSPNISGRQ